VSERDAASHLTEVADLAAHPLWAAAADGLVLVDHHGTIRLTNNALDELFGYGPGELVGASIEQLVPHETREEHVGFRDGYDARPRTRTMASSQLLEGLRRDDSTFPTTISLSRIRTAEGEMSIGTVRDLTERVRVENEVALANRRRAIAEDHDRIASELHDTVIQQLFALGLSLQSLPMRISEPDSAQRVGAAVDTIDEIIAKIRNTIHGLRIPPDTELGLRHRVLAIVAEMTPGLPGPPEVRLHGDIDSITDAAIVDHLLPTLREALSNAGKHANADTVIVSLRCDDRVILEVIDDGRGLPTDVKRSGLANLAARAAALGGALTIEPGVDGGGTVVRWAVPRQVDT